MSSARRSRTATAPSQPAAAYLLTPARFVFADGGLAGRLLDWAQTILRTTMHIVRKPADQRGFAVIPRRWAVERTFAWLTAHRRLARDYERNPAVSEAMIRWAAINGMVRRPSTSLDPRRPQGLTLLKHALRARISHVL